MPTTSLRSIPSPACINEDTVIARAPSASPVAPTQWNYCYFKVALADCEMQTVIDLVRSGAFAKHGLWLNDVDVTIDCAGVLRCKDLKAHLLGADRVLTDKQALTGDAGDEVDDRGWPTNEGCRVVLDQAHKVGHNCLAWRQMDASGLLTRAKVYSKMIQEFETRAVRYFQSTIPLKKPAQMNACHVTAETHTYAQDGLGGRARTVE
eukprot:1353623-Prymnesium_polylepis.2